MSDTQETSKRGFGTPGIVQVAPGLAAVEWGRMRFADIRDFHHSARDHVAAALSERNIGKSGPGITFSRAPSGDTIELAPGVMIERAFEPAGPVTIQEIPAGTAAHLKLEGPYEQLPQAWGALMAWVHSQALKPNGLNWEIYGDPAVPVTDLYVLLK